MRSNKTTIVFLFICGLGFCQEAIQYSDVCFPGSGTKYIGKDEEGKEVERSSWTTDFKTQLNDAYARFGTMTNQVVVGHSQGGMRAISYASYSEKKKDKERTVADAYLPKSGIKAVVDIAGPINGYTPLAGGADAMGRRLKKLVLDIGDAYCAKSVAIPNAASTLTPWISDTYFANLLKSYGMPDLSGFAEGLDNTGLVKAFLRGKINESGFISDDVLMDFTPGSLYQLNYLSWRLHPIIENEPYTYTTTAIVQQTAGYWAKTFSHNDYTIKFIEGKFVVVTVPVYKQVYVLPTFALVTTVHNATKPVLYIATLKPILEDTYVAAFYGTNKDPLSLLDIEGVDPESLRQSIGDFSDRCQEMNTVYTGIAAIWTASAALSAVSLNAISFAACTVEAACFASLADDCNTGYELSKDYIKTYHEKILNTSGGSDGFIPNESTAFSTAKFGGTPLDSVRGAYIRMEGENHMSLYNGQAMWGAGASMNNPKKGQGRVGEVLRYGGRGFENCFDNWNMFSDKL